MVRIGLAAIAAALLSASSASGQAIQGTNAVLYRHLQATFGNVRRVSAAAGYSAQFQQELSEAHRHILVAVQRNDDRLFRTALLRFLDLSRARMMGRANFADATTHGAGGGGSSTTFSQGWNSTMGLIAANMRRNADRNPVTCMYLYGDRELSDAERYALYRAGRMGAWSTSLFEHCDTPQLDQLRNTLQAGRGRIFGIGRFLRLY